MPRIAAVALATLCVLWIALVLACGGAGEQAAPNQPTGNVTPKAELPPYRMVDAPAGRRDQYRVVGDRSWDEHRFSEAAVAVARDGGSDTALVYFFDDRAAVEGWQGTSGVGNEHQRSYICQVNIDGGAASHFHRPKSWGSSEPYEPPGR